MADSQTFGLTAGTPDTTWFVMGQDATGAAGGKKITLAQILNLTGVVANLTAVTSAINTTETNIVSYTVAANAMIVGTTYEVVVYGTCTSTVANASNIRVRIGTAGTSSDAIAAVVTPTAATSGTSVPFMARFLITIRTTGSTGTAGGNGQLTNNGVTGVSNAADVVGTPTAITVNTTVQNIIHLSYVAAATTTTSTFQIATIEILKL